MVRKATINVTLETSVLTLKFLTQILPSPQRGEMFIEGCKELPRSGGAKCAFWLYQTFRSYRARKFVRVVVYEHLVPLGQSTNAPIHRLVCYANFRVRTLESLAKTYLARRHDLISRHTSLEEVCQFLEALSPVLHPVTWRS